MLIKKNVDLQFIIKTKVTSFRHGRL